MTCPHCGNTIREEQRYLMSRAPDEGMVWTPLQRKAAMLLLLFLIVLGFFSLAVSHL